MFFFGFAVIAISIGFAMRRLVFPRGDLGRCLPSVVSCLRMCWSCLRRLAIVLSSDDFGIFCWVHDVSLHRPFDLGALYYSRCDVVRFHKRQVLPIGVCLECSWVRGCSAFYVLGFWGFAGCIFILLDCFYVYARLGFGKILILWAPYRKTRTRSICLVLRFDVLLAIIRVGF